MMTALPGIHNLLCPACNNEQTKCIGKLTERNGIIRLSSPGDLYRCKVCNLFFRSPYPPQGLLTEQYSGLPSDLWSGNERPDSILAAQTIQNFFSYGKVLDVGCYRGDFLEILPERYQKFGIEPSYSACQISKTRGITMIAPSINEIDDCKTTFQAITLLDLIEHMSDPLDTLRKLCNLLAPGGIIILSTGNTDALPWRLMRLDYWYYYSEHVSFFNPKWFSWLAGQLSLKVVFFKTFSHFQGSVLDQARQLARCFTFWVTKSCEAIPLIRKPLVRIYPFNKVEEWSAPPTAYLWPDHLFIVLKSI
jgi:SAM-dependent methyltransferase